MEVVTVKRLAEILKNEVKNGNGNKKILLSDDDEGNGFHKMFYEVTPITEDNQKYYSDVHLRNGDKITDYVVLG